MSALSAFLACVLVILLCSSPAFTDVKFRPIQESSFVIENQPTEFQCILTWEERDDVDRSKPKITWEGPDPKDRQEIEFTGNNANATIEIKVEQFKITSTLRLLSPHFEYSPHSPSYRCTLKNLNTGGADQHGFPISYLQAKAVPVVNTDKAPPARFGETVVLNCSVSYENQGGADLDFNVSWIKDGKLVENKAYEYKRGPPTEPLSYSLVVKSFKDGGTYVCRSTLRDITQDTFEKNDSLVLSILPYLNGPAEKEVKDDQGSDVKLTCDVVGYPIRFEWKDEEDNAIDLDSRIRQEKNVLYINDIDYSDRKTFKCVGYVGNETVTQDIILRVKDPLAPLWPFIGIIIEAIVVIVIILASEYWKKRNQSEKDGDGVGDEKKTEITDQPSTSLA